MAAFAVNRGTQFFPGFPGRALLTSWAKREYSSAISVRGTARRRSQESKIQKLPSVDGHGKKESSLFRSGVSSGGREACSSKSVGCRFPAQSSGDGSAYEMFSFSTEPELDAVFNDVGEYLALEDSTGSEMYPMECEFVEGSEQLFDKPQLVSDNTHSERDRTSFKILKEDAEKMAIESLATRSFTAVELGKKLGGKKYPPDVVQSVIVELKSRGLLNDGLYAESFSQSRWMSSSWGPRRIRRALLHKGVSEADIEKAIHLVFKECNASSGPQGTYVGMSKISMDRLFVQASKQWLRGQNVSLTNRRSRILRWLQYRGFDWRVTNFILKELESKYPP